jgi:hypothetical protein
MWLIRRKRRASGQGPCNFRDTGDVWWLNTKQDKACSGNTEQEKLSRSLKENGPVLNEGTMEFNLERQKKTTIPAKQNTPSANGDMNLQALSCSTLFGRSVSAFSLRTIN